MLEREQKVIKASNSSYVVTLPAPFVQENHLEKGSSINVTWDKDILVVYLSDTSRRKVRKILR